MDKQKLEKVLSEAFDYAKNLCNEGKENRTRSKCFVDSLHVKLDCHYKKKDIKVYSAGAPVEFLHDISILQIKEVESPMKRGQIDRIKGVLWQIESELSDSPRDFLADLNKLAAGTLNSNKLFVVQHCWLNNEYKKKEWAKVQVEAIAEQQNGLFFVAFIPHPSDWDKDNELPVKLCKIK